MYSNHSRQVKNNDQTIRFKAVLTLSTGKTVELKTDWIQAHWTQVDNDRRALVTRAQDRRRELAHQYGLKNIFIRIFQETRQTLQVVETTTRGDLYSELPPISE